MVDECWNDVVGYEGLYEVSNFGRVRSVDRYGYHMQGNTAVRRFYSGKILRQTKCKNGYMQVCLHDSDGLVKSCRVHRLVASAFIPNPNNLGYVDHINYVRDDNRVDNLRWVTQQENIASAVASGHMDMTERIKILCSDKVRKANMLSLSKPVLRSDGEIFDSVTLAAENLGVTKNAVSYALQDESRKCCGYGFRFYRDKEA